MAVVLVTGASSGIGQAMALALAQRNDRVHVLGRDDARLEQTAQQIVARGATAETHAIDLASTSTAAAAQLDALVERIDGLDVLVHAAGTVALGTVETLDVAQLDAQYQLNTRAPYVLTQRLIPALRKNKGQIVFVNSGAGLNARATWTAYAMTKFALRALADALREELKGDGIRVLSVFPGRTATPMQAEVHRQEGKPYDPSRFVRAEDVATMVTTALALPRTSNVLDINIRQPE